MESRNWRAESDYQILLVSSNEDPKQEAARIRTLLDRRIDGLIVAARPTTKSRRSAIRSARCRRRCWSIAVSALAGFDTIAADNAEAGYRGCKHLLELGQPRYRDPRHPSEAEEYRHPASRLPQGFGRSGDRKARAGHHRRARRRGVPVPRSNVSYAAPIARPPSSARPTPQRSAPSRRSARVGLDLPEGCFAARDRRCRLDVGVAPLRQRRGAAGRGDGRASLAAAEPAPCRNSAKSARILLPCTLHVRESTQPLNNFRHARA